MAGLWGHPKFLNSIIMNLVSSPGCVVFSAISFNKLWFRIGGISLASTFRRYCCGIKMCVLGSCASISIGNLMPSALQSFSSKHNGGTVLCSVSSPKVGRHMLGPLFDSNMVPVGCCCCFPLPSMVVSRKHFDTSG